MTKQHIIDEIKRTAKENGGVPLGGGRFLKETGIRQSERIGKFWVRWSDAIREAGFEPNQKQAAIDHNVLLEKLIALIRELGHFPVVAELRMKDTRDPTFPNFKTFSKFGPKHELVGKVRAYCEARSGYEDVAALCAAIAPSIGKSGEKVKDADSVFGFVYLMKVGKNYKIGRSNSVGVASMSSAFCCRTHRPRFTRSKPMTRQGSRPIGMGALLPNAKGANGSR